MVRSDAGSMEFAANDQQLILTAYNDQARWKAQIWDIRDGAARQHERDTQWKERRALEGWGKRHLQELLAQQRAAKPPKKNFVDPWGDFLSSDKEDAGVLAKIVLEHDESLAPTQRFDRNLSVAGWPFPW